MRETGELSNGSSGSHDPPAMCQGDMLASPIGLLQRRLSVLPAVKKETSPAFAG